ncbi:MAG TPA: carboxylating nicotinate-nucleotide diphosphorylase, partial [Woeseiaceae bacterium]|nr:carboxylating nicotinate-nucleotide diphosphorylase [Woeseiaceae bacterium]
GPARALLSGERTALNFLQLLSGTATITAQYVAAVAGTRTRILDTRKTVPGLRLAQKYAVRCGGGTNHRVGLFDAILIKENHISSAGGIAEAIAWARAAHPKLPVEIEVESIDELRVALAARTDRLLLDNFTQAELQQAVEINQAEGNPPVELEASGGLTLDEIAEIAAIGVDHISVGALTKHVRAIDLSMRVETDL